jgi:tetratricopeptide (TPR) repeat protein
VWQQLAWQEERAMTAPTNNVYEMQLLVRPGPGCNMPPDAIGGEVLCFVGAPDHMTAFRLAVEELTSRGFVVEELIGKEVRQIVPETWARHAQDLCRHFASRLCDSEASIKASLPKAADLRKLRKEGGFHLGPFYCWDTEPAAQQEQAEDDEGLSDEEIERHKEFYNRGYELIKEAIFSETGPLLATTDAEREQVREAIRCFEQALAIVPTNWQAMLLLGKAHQCLAEHEQALAAFLQAQKCEPTQVMIAVEVGSAAGRLGQHDLAIRVMEAAHQHHPDDPRLPFNLGLSYLFLGDFAGARRAFERAIELEPDREANRRLLSLVNDVASGKRTCPRNEAEISRALS